MNDLAVAWLIVNVLVGGFLTVVILFVTWHSGRAPR